MLTLSKTKSSSRDWRCAALFLRSTGRDNERAPTGHKRRFSFLFYRVELVLRLLHLRLHGDHLVGVLLSTLGLGLARILETEEHRSELGQPLPIDGCNTLHIFLDCHDELMIDNVVGRHAHAVQGARGMQMTRHAGAQVDVLADALEARRMMKVCRTNALADNVPVGAAADHLELERDHDVLELLANLAHLLHRLLVYEVIGAPVGRVAVELPLLVQVEQRQVVRLGHLELLLFGYGLLFAALGSIEYRRHGQHRDDDQELGAAAHLTGDNDQFAERRIERKLDHLSAQVGQAARVVERAQYPQLIHRVHHVLAGWRIHEVELQQVLHAQRLEQQYDVGQVGPLDLGHVDLEHFLAKIPLRVQAKALANQMDTLLHV